MGTNQIYKSQILWKITNIQTDEVIEGNTYYVVRQIDVKAKELKEAAERKVLLKGKYEVLNVTKEKESKRSKIHSLDSVNKEARARGMSYGQYMLFLQLEKEKKEKMEAKKAFAIC